MCDPCRAKHIERFCRRESRRDRFANIIVIEQIFKNAKAGINQHKKEERTEHLLLFDFLGANKYRNHGKVLVKAISEDFVIIVPAAAIGVGC